MTVRFDVERVQRCTPLQSTAGSGDRRDGSVYVYHQKDIELAVKVALATSRPLLVDGPSGCGKSTLAFNAALSLGRRYYEFVVTNRSEAQDLLWSMDNIRRLNDANVNQLKPDEAYIQPGVLWWAFDPESASQRGSRSELAEDLCALDPNRGLQAEEAVILIDEIDKADPDMPNGLLVPLGSLQFSVDITSSTVRASKPPLIIITTNNERELPAAFLRRCVVLQVPPPDIETLLEIARALDPEKNYEHDFLQGIAEAVANLRELGGEGQTCSTAEFLDTVRACHQLDIHPTSQEFQRLVNITVRKSRNDKDNQNWD